MSRVIKFRARWRDTGEVISDFCDDYLVDAVNDEAFIVDQFTGMQDKNGVDIYADDICTIYIDGYYSNDQFNTDGDIKITGKVIEFDFGWILWSDSPGSIWLGDIANDDSIMWIEVIGNIHQGENIKEKI